MSGPAGSRVPVLLYHSLSTEATARYRPWAVDPGRFEEQMERLAASGYGTLSVGDYAATLADAAQPLPPRPVVLTFDDGFEDLHRVALPILDRLGLRATAYLVTDGIGGTSRWLAADGEGERPLLAWSQVRELADHGVEIGSHSRSHPELDTLGRGRARDEIRGSRAALEDALGRAVTTFAYPYGYHSGLVKELIAEAGFTSACGVKHAVSHGADDRWSIARIIVSWDTPSEVFARWLDGEDLPLGWTRERLQTTVWRGVRRVRGRLTGAAGAPGATRPGADSHGGTA